MYLSVSSVEAIELDDDTVMVWPASSYDLDGAEVRVGIHCAAAPTCVDSEFDSVIDLSPI